MNNLFFGILCTVLGAAVGGLITISSPQAQKNITNSLFAATGGVVAVWIGYGLGRWHAKREQEEKGCATSSMSATPTSPSAPTPTFKITYPHREVDYVATVQGSFENLSEDDEVGVWLYVFDDRLIYTPHKVRDIDRILRQWKVESVSFGRQNSSDDSKNYDIQVILADSNASNELRAGQDNGLRQLPQGGIKRISDRVTVKRKPYRASAALDVTVSIEGSASAPLGKTTYYTIISQNAVRGVWSIGGFQNNESFEVKPLSSSHQIHVEPTDAARVGESFIIVFTAYSATGKSVTATKRFLVVPN